MTALSVETERYRNSKAVMVFISMISKRVCFIFICSYV